MSTRTSDATGVAHAEEEDESLDLLVRLAEGERSALAEAYDRHHAVVRAFAQRLLADAAAAEDLVHDVFLALPRAVQRFEGRSSLRTFLIAMAVRQCHKHVRRAASFRKAQRRLSSAAPERAESPSDTHARRELAGLLARALDALPLDQRVVLVLCEVEERSSVEAAAIIGAPEATVRTRLMRAKQKLRVALEDVR